jgi:TPR repeat protein
MCAMEIIESSSLSEDFYWSTKNNDQSHYELLETAQIIMEDGDIGAAMDIFRNLADQTKANSKILAIANYQLAVSYHYGLEGHVNLLTAASFYRKAAEHGHPIAEHNLQVLISTNPELDAYSKSSYYGGSPISDNSLFDYSDSWGDMPYDTPQGNGKQSSSLIISDDEFLPFNTTSVHEGQSKSVEQLLEEGDFKGAHEKLIDLAKQGNWKAHYQLGLIYKNGEQVIQDNQTAIKHLKAAAEGGLILAAYCDLGDISFKTGDYEQAYTYYQMGLDELELQVVQQNWLSLAASKLTSNDIKTAHTLYSNLEKNGSVEAMLQLGKMYMDGVYVSKSHTTAEIYLTKACTKIDSIDDADRTEEQRALLARGADMLGDSYQYRMIHKRDLGLAMQWYRLAFNAGNKDSAIKIAKIHMNPGALEAERTDDVLIWLGNAKTDSQDKKAANACVEWYENRSFWASKIENPVQLQLIAGFYQLAKKTVPVEIAMVIKLNTNVNTENI